MAGVARFVASSLAPAAQRFAPQAAAGALRQVLEIAIDGYQRFPGAERVAETKLAKVGGDPQLAIDAVIDQHIRLAGVQGFATGLGGLVTLPVALPANLTGIAIVQARMVAAIAHLRGYDLGDPRVRTAVITCLLGEDGITDRLEKSSLPTSPLAIATAPVFDPELDRQVAGEVVGELIARISGKKMALTFTRRVPLLGGAVAATVDGWSTYRVGQYADKSLVRRIRRPIEP
ncbi:EcsC family protein [Kribbella sp. NPDC050281]|uniref:EcsC family protein n=1 Tax=Kribbella sp. NPDC050281 TaxID=3155515 RepID=UPI003411D511